MFNTEKRRRKMGKMFCRYLPEDIIFDIFSRLQVKHLLPCRRVSRPWRKLLTSSHFIKFHLEKSMKTNPKLILTSDSSSKFSSLEIETFIPNSLTIDHKSSHHKREYSVVGSCNGLLCLFEYGMYISLWNPSLHEYFELPYDPMNPKTPVEKTSTTVGFGYSSTTNEYKVMRFIHYFSFQKNYHLSEAKVYTLGVDKASWRSVEIEDPDVFQNPNHAVAHLDGVFYWLNTSRRRTNDEETKVVCFNLENESFHTMSCPEVKIGKGKLNLGVLQERLCFSQQRGFNCLDMWLMKDSSWIQLFTIDLPNSLQVRAYAVNYGASFEPIAFRKNGEVIVKFGRNDFLVYDPSKDTYRYPFIRGIHHWSLSFTYVEALTSLASITGRACMEHKHGYYKAWAILSNIFSFHSRRNSFDDAVEGAGNSFLMAMACGATV